MNGQPGHKLNAEGKFNRDGQEVQDKSFKVLILHLLSIPVNSFFRYTWHRG
jgi:hypothetical protein